MQLSSLTVYPLKGGRGISLQRSRLTRFGLQHDREWLVVDEKSGKAVTQRQNGRLALIVPALSEEALTLAVPGHGLLSVPLSRGPPSPKTVSVWEWTGAADDQGDAPAAVLSAFLGRAVRLVRWLPSSHRPVDPLYASAEHAAMFCDGFPLMLIADASLAALNSRLEAAVPMDRFRPNLTLSGAPPFAEDAYPATLHVGGSGVTLAAVKPCSRCKVPTIDQASGEAGLEPQRTLALFRRGSDLGLVSPAEGESWSGATFMGQNLLVQALGDGVVRVGDLVKLA